MDLINNTRGDYRFLTGIAPYSSGVIANPGFEIIHVILHEPIAYRAGFDRVAQHLEREGRARSALCAIELRLPDPVSFAGFTNFNTGYQALVADWDLLVDGINPIARTNVAPEIVHLPEPSLYGFSYTRQADPGRATFVVAGAGDIVEQNLSTYAIVREGETSVDAMGEKATHVMSVMSARLSGLGVRWEDVTAVDIYTVQLLEAYIREAVLTPMGSSSVHGAHWHYVRPPILGLEFEMDVRGVVTELHLTAR
ncbi:MAG: RidA family protein [Proteobacteria bacterium]|nr:RidA family protein [Pseudomonadota bacterium]